MKEILAILFSLCFIQPSFAGTKCDRTPEGYETNCVHIPGWKDPALHVTEEDMKGMVYVSPEQKRKMDEKIFREKLQEEITIRKSQDFRLDDADAFAEILAGKPRRF